MPNASLKNNNYKYSSLPPPPDRTWDKVNDPKVGLKWGGEGRAQVEARPLLDLLVIDPLSAM